MERVVAVPSHGERMPRWNIANTAKVKAALKGDKAVDLAKCV